MRASEASNFATPDSAAAFTQTHWSVVQQAGNDTSPQSLVALDQLCHSYWFPLYAYVRRCGQTPEDAQDLTQEFFAKLLEKNWLRAASPERGRFRWFLLASFKHFLANEWDRPRTKKRGGGRQPLSFDEMSPEERYSLEPSDTLSPDKLYDRTWAMTLLEKTRTRLREEFKTAGKAERFEMLEQFLPGEQAKTSYAELAKRLGVAEGTIKSEVRFLHFLLRTAVGSDCRKPGQTRQRTKCETKCKTMHPAPKMSKVQTVLNARTRCPVRNRVSLELVLML
jgi:RNA polymerase sigma-70 factor (ECF subfamily)